MNLASRCSRIFLMTDGSSMHAIILTAPPQRLQIVTSILNTRLSLCAQVIFWCSLTGSSAFFLSLASSLLALPLPRFAGVPLGGPIFDTKKLS